METNHRKSFMRAIESYFNKAGSLKNYDNANYVSKEERNVPISSQEPEHKTIENVNYVKFTEDFNLMIENNWVPCGKTILKTDKFTQKFKKA